MPFVTHRSESLLTSQSSTTDPLTTAATDLALLGHQGSTLESAKLSYSSSASSTIADDYTEAIPVEASYTHDLTLQELTTQEFTTEPANSGDVSSVDLPPVAAAPAFAKAQADFNGDGQSDILWRDYATGQNLLWLMNGTTLGTAASIGYVPDTNWQIGGTGDFNSDTKLDILWRNYATGENAVWFMDGTTFSAATYLDRVQDANWLIQGAGDFTGNGKADILWRHQATGHNAIWEMDGTTIAAVFTLPDAPGSNLKIQAIGDFNQDNKLDVLWRNTLSHENVVWLMDGTTVSSIAMLPTIHDANWQIIATGDYNADGKTDLLWRNQATDQKLAWMMNGLAFGSSAWIESLNQPAWSIVQQSSLATSSLITVSDRSFSGLEGDTGTFKIRLNQAPTTSVNLTFSTGGLITLDADGSIANGTQTTLIFTPENWNQAQTVWFVVEQDSSSFDRLMGNTVSYSISGDVTSSGTYDLGSVINTYAPDPTRFNIDLDFRNDDEGFWTPRRRAIAQAAANDWAVAIANEWSDFKLSNSLGRLDNAQARTVSFTSNRHVDDVVIFVNPYRGASAGEPALAGPDYEFGGWNTAAGVMPRVGQMAVNAAALYHHSDWVLYQLIAHEMGHVLGLLGLNWIGYTLQDRATGTFRGEYSRAANGGTYLPLQSQDGGDYAHPAHQVQSVMSYGWTYSLYGPTAIDLAMLADSGYQVYGINA